MSVWHTAPALEKTILTLYFHLNINHISMKMSLLHLHRRV